MQTKRLNAKSPPGCTNWKRNATRLRKEVDTTAARLGTPLPTKEEIAAKRTDCERLIRLSAEIDATRLSPEDTTRLDSLSARFTDGCPTEETIESARASLAEATTLESENQNLRVQAETLRSIAKIRKEAQKAGKKPVPKAVYLIPALVLLIAAIPLFALSLTVPAVIVLAAGLLCGAAGVVLAAREKPEPVEPVQDDDGTAEYERKIAENSRRAAELRGDVLKLTGEGSDPSTALSRLAADVREYRTLARPKNGVCKKAGDAGERIRRTFRPCQSLPCPLVRSRQRQAVGTPCAAGSVA